MTVVVAPLRYRWLLQARPQPPVYGDYTDVLFFLSDALIALTLGLWAVSVLIEPRPVRTGPALLRWPLAALVVIAAATVITSVDAALSAYHLLRLVGMALFALYILNETKSVDDLLLPIALMVALQAVIGIGQVLQQHSVGLELWGEYSLDPQISGVSVVFGPDGHRFLRAYGLSDHPNLLGGCLAFGLVLMLGRIEAVRPHWRMLWASAFALGVSALYLTFSRSAWLAFGAGTAVMLGLHVYRRQRRIVADCAGLLAAAALVAAPFVWQTWPYLGMRLDLESSPVNVEPVSERAYLNQATNQVFQQHALTGVGLGALPLALRAAYPTFPLDYQPAHVVLLVVAAEIGLLGALAYTLALGAPWLLVWLKRRTLSSELIALTGALAAVTVVSFLDYYPWLLAPGRLWVWLIWALWALHFDQDQRHA
ncbi:MAG: O-antigen ligase family protein [Anaerolineales bacterium]